MMRKIGLLAAVALSSCGSDGGGAPAPGPANAVPVITSASTAQVNENIAGPAYRATATDANGQSLTYSITGGADAARFAIAAATGDVSFVAAPDFEQPSDAGSNNVYDITVGASDGLATTTLAVAITVRDVVDNARFRRIATGFAQPLFVTGAGDNSARAFVVEKGGRIRILNPSTGAINAIAFLDLSTQISANNERGLLGVAFAPDYATSGVFYVYLTNPAGDTEVRRYRVSADPNIADAASGDVVMTFPRPASNHVGGWIGFGADGLLYIASGDGGGGNTSATNPAQDLNSLLGKILRIDVSGDDFPSDPARDYRIPTANPFSVSGGAPEIAAFGLRNPFRASFDSVTGLLVIGDVGESAREEIDIMPRGTVGQNFGWVRFEGTAVLQPSAQAPNALPPVLEYLHGANPFGAFNGNSITGGVVNRGPVEAMQGEYIFGDYVAGQIWSVPVGSLVQGTTIGAGQFTRQTDVLRPDVGTINNISSFGVDDARNVYVVDIDGEIYRLEKI